MTRILNLRSAGRAVLRLGSGWKRARPGRGMAEKIGRVIGELESLNRSTERDFLAVGDKLMEFRTSARAISSDMAAVTELIAGEQGRNASAALDQLLAHSHEMDSGIERSEEALCTVRELSARLRKAFAGLPNMVAVVQSLCTLTQIETARLGGEGADLGHLAAEIRPLSESIQASGESVVASSNRLDEAVQRAMRGGAELRATQLKQMPALIAGVLAGLQSFEERRRLALESSQRQASEFAAVTEAIDDLVGSIQFHDITRQQLEHVLEALRRLRGVAAGAGGGYSAHEARTILRLQRSQLEEAERLFVESIERMDRSLEAISGRLQNAAEAVQNLTGGAGDGQDFFAKMEAQFASIVKLLGACTAAQREIESTATGLAQTIGGMQTSVASIRGTEI
ncbi:MAG TPA: hypothetical protein VFW44_18765, partial [Bryobacteraceae bacterium]|nr:hypothetical protein [Bryobacteraceae bacterium]